jgi:hemolysin activation/secretion protein
MSKINISTTLMAEIFACSLMSQAFAASPPPPTAGSEIQQVPKLPTPLKTNPDIPLQGGHTPALAAPDEVKIAVESLHINGQTLYSEAKLLAVTGFSPKSQLSLSDLRTMASNIAQYYHEQGYFVAQAYLPAQDIKNGAITITVVEGQYGKITLNNQSTLSDSLANSLLDGLKAKDTIAVTPLEQRLLLLSDIPGVNVKSTLTPGASVGASDLIINVTPGQRVTGSVDADNEGSRYTGSNRLGFTAYMNEPLGHGDVANIRLLTSADGLSYGRASYQTQFNKAKIGTAYTTMAYRLDQEFSSLNANGTAKIASFYGSYPLIRSRSTNLSAQINVDDKSFHDTVNSTSTVTDKKAQVWMASLTGDHQDAIGGGGLSSYSLSWASGNIDIRSPDALTADTKTIHTNGHYDKLSLNAMRLQSMTENTSFYAAINAQLASKNLDISEKMGLGGAEAVRAYPSGEGYGDRGYILNLEIRQSLPKFCKQLPGQLQLIGFVDTGTITANKDPISPEQNRKTLSGTGFGVNWMSQNNFAVKMYFAHKLGNSIATSAPDSMNRFWIQGVKYF